MSRRDTRGSKVMHGVQKKGVVVQERATWRLNGNNVPGTTSIDIITSKAGQRAIEQASKVKLERCA